MAFGQHLLSGPDNMFGLSLGRVRYGTQEVQSRVDRRQASKSGSTDRVGSSDSGGREGARLGGADLVSTTGRS